MTIEATIVQSRVSIAMHRAPVRTGLAVARVTRAEVAQAVARFTPAPAVTALHRRPIEVTLR